MSSTHFSFDDLDGPAEVPSSQEPPLFGAPSQGEFASDITSVVVPSSSVTGGAVGGNFGGGNLNSEVESLSIHTDTAFDKNKVGLVIIDPNSETSTNLCKGAIGGANGNKFCIKIGCSVFTHKFNKTSIPTDGPRFYIRGPRANQAYCRPSLLVDWVQSEKDKLILKNELKSPAVWNLFFKNFNAPIEQDSIMSDSVASGFEVTAKETLEQLQLAKDAFKTPNKRPIVTTSLLSSAMDIQESALPKRAKLV